MRLYTRTGATALDDPEFGHFEPGPDGGFDFPEDLSDRLRRFHVGGEPGWETDVERQYRLMAEDLERRKDPATLLDAVQAIQQATEANRRATAELAEVVKMAMAALQPLSEPALAVKARPAKKAAGATPAE